METPLSMKHIIPLGQGQGLRNNQISSRSWRSSVTPQGHTAAPVKIDDKPTTIVKVSDKMPPLRKATLCHQPDPHQKIAFTSHAMIC